MSAAFINGSTYNTSAAKNADNNTLFDFLAPQTLNEFTKGFMWPSPICAVWIVSKHLADMNISYVSLPFE